MPLHQQLVDQIEDRVASGVLQAGEKLPSVREIARTLVINPMTVSKAYKQLAAAGVLERRRGARMVVSRQNVPLVESARAGLLGPALLRAAGKARDLRIEPGEASVQFAAAMRRVSGPSGAAGAE